MSAAPFTGASTSNQADPTQSLLRWGIENAEPGSLIPLHEEIKAGKRPDLNTDILKALMGTTDSDRMKECVQVIEGTFVDRDGNGRKEGTITKADKLRAWDDLEMLIEDLDNANNLENLRLWPPIIKYLIDPDDDVNMRALWVCGTAIQNNSKAQTAFLDHDPLPIINNFLLSRNPSLATKNKAMYCLSACLKHQNSAVEKFSALNGWATLDQCLKDPSLVLRNKTAFLLSQLVMQTKNVLELVAAFRESKILTTLLLSLSPSSHLPTGPNGEEVEIDADYREKALRIFVNIMEMVDPRKQSEIFSLQEKEQLEKELAAMEAEADWTADSIGLSQEEWRLFTEDIRS